MASQWQNFLRNLGEWRGSFTSLDREGRELERTPSVLTLTSHEEGQRVQFGLQRWPADTAIAAGGGPGEGAGAPSRNLEQEYRSLGRQVVFFETGTFCKGTLQVAPNTAFGAEFGFIAADRRHRLVQLYDPAGVVEQLVLIREFRAGSGAGECPPGSAEQLGGRWRGQSATISADWPEPERSSCDLAFGEPELAGLRLLPDGGFCRMPERVSHRQGFQLEAGWLAAPGRMQRLIRRYDASGAWQSATFEQLERLGCA